MNKKAIICNHVSYQKNSEQILTDISGEIIKGNITTFVGPSGAGKTTFFKLLNGLLSPSEGSINIDGKPIESYSPIDLRRTVGIALQEATMTNATVRENLMLPYQLSNRTFNDKIANHLINQVGLSNDVLSKQTNDLSGGQRQKLSIARTLANQPKILLLDEITSSLDRLSQTGIETLIKNINTEYGTTILWITHNLQQAIDVGHDTWVMVNGQVIEKGPSELLENPKTELVREFVKGVHK
ncbi:Carnitine transport ATP-binding protein OpuCA [Paraliobacillus sp. PM-2]|uniref:ABC transporter ATP-binding protein n=1 Tax=Paraliobacillus sp. PM-2 TaxID=1462524 RepID=UPI00061C0FB3|nr:phosphate ABC transporter ATP-binding protein [Paraliobacillus sp. PM-2]CQR47915.1 Carnitine transport ATP-binding protein OpuCA [Paraliobacillus sp. PM-2]